jgi:hypothetical protein
LTKPIPVPEDRYWLLASVDSLTTVRKLWLEMFEEESAAVVVCTV